MSDETPIGWGYLQTGSNGEIYLDEEIEDILLNNHQWLSHSVLEEERMLSIVRNGKYNWEDRDFLRERLQPYWERKLLSMSTSSLS